MEEEKDVVTETAIKSSPAQLFDMIDYFSYNQIPDFCNRFKVNEAVSIKWIISELQLWSVKEVMKLLNALVAKYSRFRAKIVWKF